MLEKRQSVVVGKHFMKRTLLLAPRITDDSVAMWRAAISMGWSVQRLNGWRVPESLSGRASELVIYGEPLFAEAVADQLSLALLEPSVDWLTMLPSAFLSRRVTLTKLVDARALSDPAFVKPAEGKVFEARVYSSGQELPGPDLVDSSLPVLCSEIVDFRLEVRSIIHLGKIVTLSPYWREGALAQDANGTWAFREDEEKQSREFLELLLADERVELPPACTVDVGLLRDGGWAVIEANPIWGAGLYGGDPEKILCAMVDSVKPWSEAQEQDKRWISKRNAAQE